ncbi:hypothetical protein NUM3379_14440 [Kineococcus sp. NUM-3379]
MREKSVRSGTRRRVQRVVAALAVAVPVAFAPPAAAEDPERLPWNELLPGLMQGYDPSSSDDCRAGRLACVDTVIRVMEQRLRPFDRSCHHRAVFGLLYLRTTEAYRRSAVVPGFYRDHPFLNHYDATFAAYWFEQEDLWRAGRTAEVAPAWRVAFEAAEARRVTGTGDMLLGMNGHINRDLPFVLAEIGLVAPDGTSRKPDHDRVYEWLNAVAEEEVAEIARRYDPTVDDRDVPGTTLDGTAVFQAIQAWRENAWRNAERLVAARRAGPLQYALTAASVEAQAEAEARAVVAATTYTSRRDLERREAWCAEHHDDR